MSKIGNIIKKVLFLVDRFHLLASKLLVSKFGNVFKKVLLGFAVFIAILFVSGIFIMFYEGDRCMRVPVYQTVMTDFEVVQQEGQTAARSEMLYEMQKFMDKYEIKTLNCFLFQGGPNRRNNYSILMVGDISADADFSEYALEKYPLKSNLQLFSTLKLCEAEPQENEDCLQVNHYLFDAWTYIYRNYIILQMAIFNPTVLRSDEEKQAFLEKHIAPRKKYERDSF